jgi:hypothetical protein
MDTSAMVPGFAFRTTKPRGNRVKGSRVSERFDRVDMMFRIRLTWPSPRGAKSAHAHDGSGAHLASRFFPVISYVLVSI